MTEPENRLGLDLAAKLLRITMLRRTSEIVGQAALADALCIEPRSLRAKLSTDRGVTDTDLRLAVAALHEHSANVLKLANTISARLGTPSHHRSN